MKLNAFRIQRFKSIYDSGWVDLEQLTVLVGKNESGKTSLLKALHKFNPFHPESYIFSTEWPRGLRKERDENFPVCSCRFVLSDDEKAKLSEVLDKEFGEDAVEIQKSYKGEYEIVDPAEFFPDKLHPHVLDEITDSLVLPDSDVAPAFKEEALNIRNEAQEITRKGTFTSLESLGSSVNDRLKPHRSPNGQPLFQNEQAWINELTTKIQEADKKFKETMTIKEEAHELLVDWLPTFIYMDDYRTFNGTCDLQEVQQRSKKKSTDEDKTIIMLMELAALDLDDEVRKISTEDPDSRQFDLDDASKTLTNEIKNRWSSRKYSVEFRADGPKFLTYVKDSNSDELIKLEERSKGFQWFFSFDLAFMYESGGTFENCVLLLDEPGLHLHPGAQKDLLKRLEAYSEENTMVYTTHLPFMLNLREPSRIRVISETESGSVVSSELSDAQPDAQLVLQASLGMAGSQSYLLSSHNLIVEGVDDYFFITEFSNFLNRSGRTGLSDEVFITPAGGASKVAYLSTMMIGQKLNVFALLDSDGSGEDAKDQLVKQWLTKYNDSSAHAHLLHEIVGATDPFAIEDIFPEDFYLIYVKQVYARQLAAHGIDEIKLSKGGMLIKRVESFMTENNIAFNKGSVAKRIRGVIAKLDEKSAKENGLEESLDRAESICKVVNNALGCNNLK
jgi:predicted ATP-dependent endonuclease of OLD family